MKRKTKITLAVISVVVVAVVIVRLFSFGLPYDTKHVNYFNVRAFSGDRITLHMLVYVDEKAAEITYRDGTKLKEYDDFYTLSARANDYDTYDYDLTINGDSVSIPLRITCHHWNWWEITESNLYLHVDTKSKTYTTYEEYGFTSEHPVYHYETDKEPKQTEEYKNGIHLYAGPKG